MGTIPPIMMPDVQLSLGVPGVPSADPLTATTGKSMLVSLIDQRHPEHMMLEPVWRQLSLLYEGGHELRHHCQEFLQKRPKEAQPVYEARTKRFTYKPHLPTALDYYSSELFEEDPHIQAVLPDGKGGSSPVPNDNKDKQFYDGFIAECDRGGTSLVDFFRRLFHNVLLFQSAFVLMDLPTFSDDAYNTKAEQDADKVFEPFLTLFDPSAAINWKLDAFGNIEWIVIKRVERMAVFGEAKGSSISTKWYYYNTEKFEVWERVSKELEAMVPNDAEAVLITEGIHKLAPYKKTPVLQLKVSGGLWLANRALLAAIDHLNTDNALGWALFMSALAMPVIATDESIDMTAQESGYIQIPHDAKYTWSEPTGHSFKHLADRIDDTKEDIFRAFYLIHQGRSGRATPTAQSAVSKQMDMMPSKDMLKMFGDLVRSFLTKVMSRVSLLRGDKFRWEVNGFTFKDDLSDAEVQMFTDFLALDIPSETLNKVIFKLLAKRAAGDTSDLTLNKIMEEIDTSKDKLTLQLDKMTKVGNVQAKLTQQELDSKEAGQDAGEEGS